MARKIESLLLAGPAGQLEALLEEPEERDPVQAALVCHPHPLHGGTMHNKVVYRVARGLRRAGCVVLRFNYRGVNLSHGEYGHGKGEMEDALTALTWLRERYPALPYTLAGFSFGSRIVLELGCTLPDPTRLIALGFPTTYTNRSYLEGCRKPKVFIQSTKDEHGPRSDFEPFYESVPEPKSMFWIEAEDHFFKGALDKLEETVTNLH